MSLTYGFVKCKITSDPKLKSSRHKREIQYHLHASLQVVGEGGRKEVWDTAINVGTNDSDDLLRYKLIFDFQHPIMDTLKGTSGGFTDLSTTDAFPALDFLRSDLMEGTGDWRDSDVMDGGEQAEPVASLLRLLRKAHTAKADVYIFGRTYTDGALGIHDVHMNQGSTGSFLNNGKDDHNDHNEIWQDGAVIVNLGQPEAAAYFTAFTQQQVPTDDLGNPESPSHEIEDSDVGSLAT